jgi:uroporphyrinogen-III decarboxylase
MVPDKSVFTPAQSIEWLGIIWDSVNFSLQIPDRRVQDLIESVSLILSEFLLITARNLAQVTGKIISMSSVIGNISRLMTRYCYMIIETRSAWDSLLEIIHSDQVATQSIEQV